MEATKVSVGDYHTKQLEDRTIPTWDCLNPLVGFSLCVVSLRHPNQPHTQLGLQQGGMLENVISPVLS